ncbi:MAG: glycerol-3-phosphate dehydrogenase subunit GlpB [Propioniciclava sp.]
MRVAVIGAGLAGLTAALRLADGGAAVTLITQGTGGLQLSQGSLDILGYAPERIDRPLAALPAFVAERPEHPYAHVAGTVAEAVGYVADLVGPALLAGDPATNLQLPTAVGAVRPTAVAPPSMTTADVGDGNAYLVVGFRRLKDFPASLVAGNLDRTAVAQVSARHAWVDLIARAGERDSSALTFARALDDAPVRDRLAQQLSALVEPDEIVLVPACLGLSDPGVAEALSHQVGHPVAEVALQPPGVPGMRLNQALIQAAKDRRVRIIAGSRVTGARRSNGRLDAVVVASAGHPTDVRADAFVYAPGGFESGALAVDSHGRITEVGLGLPLTATDARGLISEDFWGSDQALFGVGVRADAALRPVDAAGEVVWANVHIAGGILAGAHRWREKSGDGIAVATAVRAADTILQEGS